MNRTHVRTRQPKKNGLVINNIAYCYSFGQEKLSDRVCVGFLQAERKDDRIGKKEGIPKREEGEKQMLAECESRWNKLAQEVLSGMRDWRVQHATATFAEIEEELDKRMARMRAGL